MFQVKTDDNANLILIWAHRHFQQNVKVPFCQKCRRWILKNALCSGKPSLTYMQNKFVPQSSLCALFNWLCVLFIPLRDYFIQLCALFICYVLFTFKLCALFIWLCVLFIPLFDYFIRLCALFIWLCAPFIRYVLFPLFALCICSFYVLFLCALFMCSFYALFVFALFMRSLYVLFLCALFSTQRL